MLELVTVLEVVVLLVLLVVMVVVAIVVVNAVAVVKMADAVPLHCRPYRPFPVGIVPGSKLHDV